LAKNHKKIPKNLDHPFIGLDFSGEIQVFSPKNVAKPSKVA
jgi:hypothetical protein